MGAQTSPESTTWTFFCVNHPHLRWTKTKCGPGFFGRGVLMFEGDAERLISGGPFPRTQRTLDGIAFSGFLGEEGAREYVEWYLSRYVPECDCPLEDLRVHAKEYQPICGRPATSPTPAQVEVFEMFVQRSAEAPASHEHRVEAWMDNGELFVQETEDGLKISSAYDRAGQPIGDLIV